jgi:hypothetical protein
LKRTVSSVLRLCCTYLTSVGGITTVVFRGKRGKEKTYQVRRQEYKKKTLSQNLLQISMSCIYVFILFMYSIDEITHFSFDRTTVDLNITYRPYVHRQPTHTEPPTRGNDKSPDGIHGHAKDSRHSTRP